MKDIVGKTIAGVLAGVILYFISDKYLTKGSEQAAMVKTPVENAVPLESPQPVQQTPVEQPTQSSPVQDQPIKHIPTIDELGPQQTNEVKLAEEPKPNELRFGEPRPEPPVLKVEQKTVDQEMGELSKEARAKRDSLAKDKKLNQEVKKVNKKTDDVFDELERETGQDTIPRPLNL
jgi:type IV secretory pathway VirB10-like protein